MRPRGSSDSFLLCPSEKHLVLPWAGCCGAVWLEGLMRDTTEVLVRDVACTGKKDSAVVVCGLHNKVFAEDLYSLISIFKSNIATSPGFFRFSCNAC